MWALERCSGCSHPNREEGPGERSIRWQAVRRNRPVSTSVGVSRTDYTARWWRRCGEATTRTCWPRSWAAPVSSPGSCGGDVWLVLGGGPAGHDRCQRAPGPPVGVKAFAYRRVNNDVRDAADLADLLRMGRLPEARIAHPRSATCGSWCAIAPSWSRSAPAGRAKCMRSWPPAGFRCGSATYWARRAPSCWTTCSSRPPSPAAPRPTSPMRCGWPSSTSGACCAPGSSHPPRSASCATTPGCGPT